MRVLVTNDDGVHAPGLGALVRALTGWQAGTGPGEVRDVVVVAPLVNYSGASAFVGTVYERESIPYRAVRIEGAEGIPVFGLDGSPALSVIVAAMGAFGPRPDLVVSGINEGVNVGRSILHSGTVGAILTGSQLGMSGLALSMQSGAPAMPWDTAADLAVALLPGLAAAPVPTLWNLNVPHLPMTELAGTRRGRIGPAGVIRAAGDPEHPGIGSPATAPGAAGPDSDSVRGGTAGILPEGEEGALVLDLGPAVPTLGDVSDEDPHADAALVAAGYASVTALRSVTEDHPDTTASPHPADPLDAGLAALGDLLRRP